jgi:hypothetical protein
MVRSPHLLWSYLSLTDTCADKLFTNGLGSVRVGTVSSIEANADAEGGVVHLEGGEAVPYAVLILALGSLWEGPLNIPVAKSDIDAHLATWRGRIKDAKHVVLAGAGAVGLGRLPMLVPTTIHS